MKLYITMIATLMTSTIMSEGGDADWDSPSQPELTEIITSAKRDQMIKDLENFQPEKKVVPQDIQNQKLTISNPEPSLERGFFTKLKTSIKEHQLRNKFIKHAQSESNAALTLREDEINLFKSLSKKEKQSIIDEWFTNHKKTFQKKLDQEHKAATKASKTFSEFRKDQEEAINTLKPNKNNEKTINDLKNEIIVSHQKFLSDREEQIHKITHDFFTTKKNNFINTLNEMTGTEVQVSKQEPKSNDETSFTQPKQEPTVNETNVITEPSDKSFYQLSNESSNETNIATESNSIKNKSLSNSTESLFQNLFKDFTEEAKIENSKNAKGNAPIILVQPKSLPTPRPTRTEYRDALSKLTPSGELPSEEELKIMQTDPTKSENADIVYRYAYAKN